MKKEYLIRIDTSKGIAKNKEGFLFLLQSNTDIKIDTDKSQINFKNIVFDYILQENNINEKNVVFHLIVKYNDIDITNFSDDNKLLKDHLQLFTKLELIVKGFTDKIEVLWDDINFKCSQIAYPKIYEIENLFRKLITKYMLVNVGTDWESKYIPSEVEKKSNNEHAKTREGGLLYKLDFIQITNFLFGERPLNSNLKQILKSSKKLKDNEGKEHSVVEVCDLENYVPKSNWDRFFKSSLDIDAEQLKKNWSELYDLRNKIAHNTFFDIEDLKKVERLVSRTKTPIERAIEKLDEVKLDETEKNDAKQVIDYTLDIQLDGVFDRINKRWIPKYDITGCLSCDYMNEVSYIESEKELGRALMDLYRAIKHFYHPEVIFDNFWDPKELLLLVGSLNGKKILSDFEIEILIDDVNCYISILEGQKTSITGHIIPMIYNCIRKITESTHAK